MKYSLWIDGKASGPYDAHQIQSLYRDGVISETDMVNPDGSKSWPMLKDVFPVEEWKGDFRTGSSFRKPSGLDFLNLGDNRGAEVNLVGINIPFWNLVLFLLKLMCAGFIAGLVFLIPYFLFWGLIIGAIIHR